MTLERLQSELKNLSQQKLEASFNLQVLKDNLRSQEAVVAGIEGALLIINGLIQEELKAGQE